MKRFFVFVTVFCLSLNFLHAQETVGLEESLEGEEQNSPAAENPSSLKISPSLFFTLGPKLMLNTDKSTESAPSPVMYSLGLGGDFVFSNGILLQAHASFFTNYYLWDGKDAQPAEVENRTGTALSLMLDLCGGYTFSLGEHQNHLLSLSGGAGFLLRYAFLSNGVDSSEKNRDTDSTAGDDVSSINDSFFKDLNFLYPEFALSYSYILSSKWKIGGETRIYLPIGSLVNGNGADGMLFSLSAKLTYR